MEDNKYISQHILIPYFHAFDYPLPSREPLFNKEFHSINLCENIYPASYEIAANIV
jgi:hypothetical protein